MTPVNGTFYPRGAPRQHLVRILKANAEKIRGLTVGSVPPDIDSWNDAPDEIRPTVHAMLIEYFKMGRQRIRNAREARERAASI